MNIGIRHATGEYFLSSDIDLIYSQNALSTLASQCSPQHQIFCQAYLIPETFDQYDGLVHKPTVFELTATETIGLFHCALLDNIVQIRGFDEYYRIWGFEDNDLSRRLELIGLESKWLDVSQAPIYHQWHPRSSLHFFMQWWWEDLSIYHATKLITTVNHKTKWGHMLTLEERSALNNLSNIEYAIPKGINRFDLARVIREIIYLGSENPDKTISIRLEKEPDITFAKSNAKTRLLKAVLKVSNKLISELGFQIRVSDRIAHRSENQVLYAMYSLLVHSELIKDYAVRENSDHYCFDFRIG